MIKENITVIKQHKIMNDLECGDVFRFSPKGPLCMRTDCTYVFLTGEKRGLKVNSCSNIDTVYPVKDCIISGTVEE